MACNPAAQIQGPGPNEGDGHPLDVNIISTGACIPVEGCPGGPPVEVSVIAGAGVNTSFFNVIPMAAYSTTQIVDLPPNLYNKSLMVIIRVDVVGTGLITPALIAVNNADAGNGINIGLGITPMRSATYSVLTLPTRYGMMFSPAASVNVFATQSGLKYINPLAVPRDLRWVMTHGATGVAWTYQVDACYFG